MKSLHLSIAITAICLGGCYHSLAPSVGYTLDHGFTYGVSYSGGYGYGGINSGVIRRPKKDETGAENIGYATFALSTLGVFEAGAGVGFGGDDGPSFAGLVNGLPVKPFSVTDGSPDIRISPTVGIRYLGKAFEIYLSPRLYMVNTGGRH